MAIRSKSVHSTVQSILTRHWQGAAYKAGTAGVWDAMLRMVERVEPALAALQARLPADFPARTAAMVFEGVRGQLKRWQQGAKALRDDAAENKESRECARPVAVSPCEAAATQAERGDRLSTRSAQ